MQKRLNSSEHSGIIIAIVGKNPFQREKDKLRNAPIMDYKIFKKVLMCKCTLILSLDKS